MESSKVNLLKEILAVPSKTGDEKRLISYLSEYLSVRGYNYIVDAMGNIYVTKGVAKSYPLVMAHTDTVHPITEMVVREVNEKDTKGEFKMALKAFTQEGDMPCGIGGDDKAGVFICLQLLEMVDNIKVYLPVQEETGCYGSQFAVDKHKGFFTDVSYSLMFDSPQNDSMSKTLMGTNLYDESSVFFQESKDFIIEHGINKWQDHPYTDSMVLRRAFGFQTLNLAAGYYNYHSKNEYVIVDDVQNSIDLGFKIISNLSEKNYTAEYVANWVSEPVDIFYDEGDDLEDDLEFVRAVDRSMYEDYMLRFDTLSLKEKYELRDYIVDLVSEEEDKYVQQRHQYFQDY